MTKAQWMENFGDWQHTECATGWSGPGSTATWTFRTVEPAEFYAEIEYTLPSEGDYSEWRITLDGQAVTFPLIDTGERNRRAAFGGAFPRFRTYRIGKLRVGGRGAHELALGPTGEAGKLARISGILLRPVRSTETSKHNAAGIAARPPSQLAIHCARFTSIPAIEAATWCRARFRPSRKDRHRSAPLRHRGHLRRHRLHVGNDLYQRRNPDAVLIVLQELDQAVVPSDLEVGAMFTPDTMEEVTNRVLEAWAFFSLPISGSEECWQSTPNAMIRFGSNSSNQPS